MIYIYYIYLYAYRLYCNHYAHVSTIDELFIPDQIDINLPNFIIQTIPDFINIYMCVRGYVYILWHYIVHQAPRIW